MTNARKSREKHRMEQDELAKRQFKEEQFKIMNENFQVFSCSGNSEGHLHTCDGECEVITLDEMDIEISKERRRWAELGMVPLGKLPQLPIPGIPVEIMSMQIQLAALFDELFELGLVDEDKINERFKKLMLERLTVIREANEEEIKESQSRARIVPAGIDTMPQLIVPEHIRRKMN